MEASAVTPTPTSNTNCFACTNVTPTPTVTPNPSGLTDKQLSAVMGIITNFILSSDSSPTPSPSKQELAIEKISKYADSSNDAPTVQDYIDAGVTGVTSANLNDVNQAVKDTSGGSADSVVEIQALVNQTNKPSTKKIYQKSFTYDTTNRVVKEDLGNGSYIEYIYDNSGNLIKQIVVK